MRRLRLHELPENWRNFPYPDNTQALGDAWARAGATLTPPEANVMLNLAHPDFRGLNIEGPTLFPVSPRLTPDAGEGDQDV